LPTVERALLEPAAGEAASPTLACEPRTETTCPIGSPAADDGSF